MIDSPGSGFGAVIDYGQYNSTGPIVGHCRPAFAFSGPTFAAPRLSDEDVERIAKRVAELLKASTETI